MAYGFRHVPRQRTASPPPSSVTAEDWAAVMQSPDEAAGRLLRNIFAAPEYRDDPPFPHTLKLPETEEEMAAEPGPSFTLSEDQL